MPRHARLRVLIPLLALGFPALIACGQSGDHGATVYPGGEGGDASGQNSSGPGAVRAGNGGGSGPGGASSSGGSLPHGPGDPCEGRKKSTVEACDLVGWADIDGDGTAEPVGVAIVGSPDLGITTVVGGRQLEHWLNRGHATNPGHLELGPDVGSLEARRHAAFVGAFDVTGDGASELALWADKSSEHDSYRVLRYTGGELRAIPVPNDGMYSHGDTWAGSRNAAGPDYRCTGRADSPLEQVGFDTAKPTRLQGLRFDAASNTFSSTGMQGAYRDEGRPVPPLGLDCADLAEHEQAPSADGVNPGEGEHCAAGRKAPAPNSDDPGQEYETVRISGEIDCGRMASMWKDYEGRIGQNADPGDAPVLDYGDHTCGLETDEDRRKSGRIGECRAKDSSWTFEARYR